MGKRVVIVDDAEFMRHVLKEILTENGFEVVGEAGGVEEAIETVRETKPDIVTMDIMLPDGDGIMALRQIKEEMPEVTVVMISALGQEDMVEEALGAGAYGFIVKPFKPSHVGDIMKRLNREEEA